MRREALTRAWSLKSAAQPLPFLEDGAVPIKELAAYGAALEALFEKHGVRSAIYGQVGAGLVCMSGQYSICATAEDVKRMRALGDGMAELLRLPMAGF